VSDEYRDRVEAERAKTRSLRVRLDRVLDDLRKVDADRNERIRAGFSEADRKLARRRRNGGL